VPQAATGRSVDSCKARASGCHALWLCKVLHRTEESQRACLRRKASQQCQGTLAVQQQAGLSSEVYATQVRLK